MIIKQDYLPKGCLARPEKMLSGPTSITIHWIGPFPGQKPLDVRQYWLKGPTGNGVQASAHYVIKDTEVLQCIPEAEVAWHCGCAGNYNSIGIEVIPMNLEGQFSTDTIETLAEVISRLPQVPLKRHYDWTGKLCPAYYVDNDSWEALKHALSNV